MVYGKHLKMIKNSEKKMEGERKNKYLLLLLASTFLIFSFGLMSAVTIDLPTANTALVGNTTFNISITAAEGFTTGVYNCSILSASASTANSTLTSLGSQSNSSANDTVINISIDLHNDILEDSNDYEFLARCYNLTAHLDSANVTYTIDNGVPTAPSGLFPTTGTTITSARTQTFYSTVVDENTTSCTYTIYRDGSASDSDSSSGSATYSATNCSATKVFTDSTENGKYYVVFTASDGTNTTASSSVTFNVGMSGNTGGLPQGTYKTADGRTLSVAQDGKISGKTWGWIIGIVVALGLIYLLSIKK